MAFPKLVGDEVHIIIPIEACERRRRDEIRGPVGAGLAQRSARRVSERR